MKKNLTKNIPLKIMSVIVGILVWLIVVNVDDPIITKGFVISDVQIINEAYVDQLGQMVMQDDSENTVRVYITGERKTVNHKMNHPKNQQAQVPEIQGAAKNGNAKAGPINAPNWARDDYKTGEH